MSTKFKDSIGRWRTASLFVQTMKNTFVHELTPMYSLTNEEAEYKGKKYPSARKLFVELQDPTGYKMANKYFGGWEHWQEIWSSPRMKAYLDAWQEELEIAMKSDAIQHLIDISQDGTKGLNAAKYVAEYAWEKKKTGRPTKAQQNSDKKKEERLRAAASRMKGISGGK